jgi:N-acetylneuraminic acid mutarotase
VAGATGGAVGIAGGGATGGSSSGAGGRGGATATGGSTNLGKWETLAPMAGARQELGIATVGGLVYAVGAFGSGATAQRLDAYDPRTNQWTARATIPFPADHPNTTGANGKLYILGETGDIKSAVYDPATNTWTMCKPIQVQRAAAATAAIGAKIYVAGGATGNNGAVFGPSVRDFAAYDTETDTWEALEQIPGVVRNHAVGASWDGIFYIVGGRTNGPTDGLQSRVDAYDPVAKTWSQKAPMPRARGGIGGGVIDGVILVVGGEGNDPAVNPNRVFPDTDAYDIATNTWRTLAPMLTPRHGTGAAAVDGKLYVPGGATAQGGGAAVAILEAFTPP